MVNYVVDTSVIARLGQPDAFNRLQKIGIHRCSVPVPVLLEYGTGARNVNDHRERIDFLRATFTVVAVSPWAQEQALDMQEKLAAAGMHRSARLADLLISAAALQLDAKVLHYDRDFDAVATVTGLTTEWISPPGTLDGQGPHTP